MLVRVAVEVLLRTGLRVGEFTALRADAVVLIGAGHWLHVPVGKLHDDRYLPLHPHLVTLIGDYRTDHVAPDNPLLLPRENGQPLSETVPMGRMLALARAGRRRDHASQGWVSVSHCFGENDRSPRTTAKDIPKNRVTNALVRDPAPTPAVGGNARAVEQRHRE